MKSKITVLTFLATIGFMSLPASHAKEKLNMIVIMADDLGYNDLGCYGGEDIPPPHIDSLANEGLRFTSGYVT